MVQEYKDAVLAPVAYNIPEVAGITKNIGAVPWGTGQECKDTGPSPAAYNILAVACMTKHIWVVPWGTGQQWKDTCRSLAYNTQVAAGNP